MAAIQQIIFALTGGNSFPGLVRYLNTASSSGGNGTTNATSGANRAFASLRETADSMPSTLANPYRVYASGVAADTLNVTQTNWDFTTSAANYLEIIGDNLTGIYNTNAYRLENTDTDIIYNNIPGHIRFYNLQGQLTYTTSGVGENVAFRGATQNVDYPDCDIRFANCIVKMVKVGGATDDAIGFGNSQFAPGAAGLIRLYNCIAYGGTYGFNSADPGVTNYNCTGYGNEFNFIDPQVCINCLGNGGIGDFVSVGTGGGLSTNNSATDGSAPGANADNGAPTFVNAGAGNFQLTNASTGARGLGVTNPASGLFLDDITGTTRSVPWDIGAWKAQP